MEFEFFNKFTGCTFVVVCDYLEIDDDFKNYFLYKDNKIAICFGSETYRLMSVEKVGDV